MSTLQLTSLLTLLLATVAHAQQPARTPVPIPNSTNAYDYFAAAGQALDNSVQDADYGYRGSPAKLDRDVIANVRLPYAVLKPPIPAPSNSLARDAWRIYDSGKDRSARGNFLMRFEYENARAVNRLILTQLALQSLHRSTGRYPHSLHELVPTQLAALPTDPFALSGPLRYKRTGHGYLLYSIGPDCTDNGGQPVVKQTSSGPSYRVIPDSQGDIVAGINTR